MALRRLFGLALVVAGLIAALAFIPHSPAELRDLVLAAGVAAPLLAVAAWVVLTPALFPGTILAAAAGLAFGTVAGTAVALAGAILGGLAAFTLGRTIARRPALRLIGRNPRLRRLHALLETRGFTAVLAARLTPGVPATGLCYAAGISPVRRRAFAPAIAIGALLKTTPYVLVGQGMAAGSALALGIAGGSVAIGAIAALLLFRRLGVPSSAQ